MRDARSRTTAALLGRADPYTLATPLGGGRTTGPREVIVPAEQPVALRQHAAPTTPPAPVVEPALPASPPVR
ncbi:hypothetical protein [Micromonospora sp. NPDC049645]|uniref:hypothetical protein n=1 Tax=Micromonospora sp. NPDC049645 TaxID=3155508 RepID=UPI00342F9C1F